jgi:cell filamentation protein
LGNLSDHYLLPNGTLRNKLGISDAAELAFREDQITTLKQAVLLRRGVPNPLTNLNLRAIHRFLFEDIYDWAGQFRICDIKKLIYQDAQEFTRFSSFRSIEFECKSLENAIVAQKLFNDLGDSEFANSAAAAFARLNAIHPFREGNGRVQRLAFQAMASAVGRDLSFDVVTKERMIDVSIRSHQGDLGAMTRLFLEIGDADRVRALRKALNFLKQNKGFPWNDVYVATTIAGQAYRGILAGLGGVDFIMRVDDTSPKMLISGAASDLPDEVEVGDAVSFTAKRF